MTDDLPGILGEIAELVDRAAALQIAAVKGGHEKVSFPRPSLLKPGHWLVEAVGIEKALKIAERYQRQRIDVPLGPFVGVRSKSHKVLRDALAQGLSAEKAAALAGVHGRTARRHKTGKVGSSGKTTAQIELPFLRR